MVLHLTSGLSRLSQPHAEDPRQRSWQCSPALYRRLPYSTSTPVQYPITPVLEHHVRPLALGRAVCGTHGTSRVQLPGRSVRTRRRSRTLPLHPLPPRTQFPPLGVLVCVRHEHITRCHAGHPLPPAVSLPFPAHLRPSAPFLHSLCPPHPPLTRSPGGPCHGTLR